MSMGRYDIFGWMLFWRAGITPIEVFVSETIDRTTGLRPTSSSVGLRPTTGKTAATSVLRVSSGLRE